MRTAVGASRPRRASRRLFGFLSCCVLLAATTLAQFGVAQAQEAETKRLNEAGFVEPVRMDPSFVLDIRYATANNFTGQKVYPSARCFLRVDISKRLQNVQALLRRQGLGLKLFDCYRPFSVQERFWNLVPDERYVGKPARKDGVIVQSSRHNRGAAVDVTLVDSQGRELPMPTGFDDFTSAAHRGSAKSGSTAARNSALLEHAMTSQGFIPLATEWWHFDGPGWEGYPPVDLPLPADH